MLAGLVACHSDGFQDALQRLFIRFQIRREPTFVANGRRVTVFLQNSFKIVKDFDAPAQRLAKIWRAERHHHEFLHVHGIVRVCAAIEDVHHRDGQRVPGAVARMARKIFVERLPRGNGSGACSGHRNRQDGVRTQFRFVRCAVGFDHPAIEPPLVGCVHSDHCFCNFGVHVPHGFQHSFAEIARFIAVTKLVGFMLTGRSAGRHGRAAKRAAFQANVHFDSRIAARVQYLAAVYRNDFGRHYCSLHAISKYGLKSTGILSSFHAARKRDSRSFQYASESARVLPYAPPYEVERQNPANSVGVILNE